MPSGHRYKYCKHDAMHDTNITIVVLLLHFNNMYLISYYYSTYIVIDAYLSL